MISRAVSTEVILYRTGFKIQIITSAVRQQLNLQKAFWDETSKCLDANIRWIRMIPIMINCTVGCL